jgi:hypothetical protein
MATTFAITRHVVLIGLQAIATVNSIAHAQSQPATSASVPADRKATYVRAVTRGGGLMTWQEAGPSEEERRFRASIEKRKDDLMAARAAVAHPVMIGPEQIEQARRNIASAEWARHWASKIRELADFVVSQPDDYVERMIPELTPGNTYGFTCPNCVGRSSQEGSGVSIARWDYRKPDLITCSQCGQVYPSEKYPETATLACPRAGQTFTYYLNDRERAEPEDRTGTLAWHWVGRPIHVSFSGHIRAAKATFMVQAAEALGTQYVLTGDPRYAVRTRQILLRLAHCYRGWLYHDYWDTIADCDPMYAAWHDHGLTLEWKRHLCEDAFARDSTTSASMLREYWGAGRVHPSTDSIQYAADLALAYDLVHDAKDDTGAAIWSASDRQLVERNLLLEYVMGAEPFAGGAGKADCVNNKSPRVYHAMAAVGRCLGLPNYVDVALRGYEGVRDNSFLFDGFSRESPGYTNMYLAELVQIPDKLDGFRWPAGWPGKEGVLHPFENDSRLRLMFRAMHDQLRPDGRLPPLSDTNIAARYAASLVEMGLKRYPEYFRGQLPGMLGKLAPTSYAAFNLAAEEMRRDDVLSMPEVCFPAWMTAFLRHGRGPDAAMIAMPFSPDGGHRHYDNLSLFYTDGSNAVLGDHGYLGDLPANAWVKSTFSHNLVIVDDAAQKHSDRRPRFRRMFTSPWVSVVEAASNAYPQCREYSRLLALVKGPESRTFVIDVFRVKGGSKHDYRVFSELAASDSPEGSLELPGLQLPPEPPLPNVGGSLARQDIFGLRDTRATTETPQPGWQAVWKQKNRQYRLWMLTPADRVEASNGPGQEMPGNPGRRVRYVDAIREGKDLWSTFVTIHEPGDAGGAMPIQRAVVLPVPREAGPDALAVQIESSWGTYTLMSEFVNEATVADYRFKGELAVLHKSPSGKRSVIAQAASSFQCGDLSFRNAAATWSGKVTGHDERSLTTDTPRPADWWTWPADTQQYVIVLADGRQTGLPVIATADQRIDVDRFPVPECSEFRLSTLNVLDE